ncbi:MAG TPA: CHY zinc finger protein [Chthoniobacterales bacterium]|nr:CHY zinc finger protein [Chthoniobacterales bacterium]
MTRTIHGLEISGIDVDPEARCVHYHSSSDIVALRFKCCGQWFPCHLCHEEVAKHEAMVWPEKEFDSVAVLCGGCGKQMKVREYLECASTCPNCSRSFNPGCVSHAHYYFAVSR